MSKSPEFQKAIELFLAVAGTIGIVIGTILAIILSYIVAYGIPSAVIVGAGYVVLHFLLHLI